MSDAGLIVRVQHAIKEVIHEQGAVDRDNFAARFAVAVSTALQHGEPLVKAITTASRHTKTNLFRQRTIKRALFQSTVAGLLSDVAPAHVVNDLTSILMRFASYAESQLAQPLKKDPSEEFLRSQLQTYLTAHGLTHREAHEGAGRTDLLFVAFGSHDEELIEVKVPQSLTAFRDGMVEAAQYAMSTDQTAVQYVVADHCPDLANPRFMLEAVKVEEIDGIRISAIRIRIAENSPSRVGAARRAAARRA